MFYDSFPPIARYMAMLNTVKHTSMLGGIYIMKLIAELDTTKLPIEVKEAILREFNSSERHHLKIRAVINLIDSYCSTTMKILP